MTLRMGHWSRNIRSAVVRGLKVSTVRCRIKTQMKDEKFLTQDDEKIFLAGLKTDSRFRYNTTWFSFFLNFLQKLRRSAIESHLTYH